MFHVLRSAPIVLLPFCTARYAQRRVFLGLPRTKLAARGLQPTGTPSPLHCSSSVRRQGHRRLRFKLERTGITYVYFTRLSTNERRSGAPGLRPRDSSVNLAPLWPEAAAPRRHRPRRDRKLRVEEALLLKLCVDGRRRVRRKLEPRKGGCYAQQQRREELHGSAGR